MRPSPKNTAWKAGFGLWDGFFARDINRSGKESELKKTGCCVWKRLFLFYKAFWVKSNGRLGLPLTR